MYYTEWAIAALADISHPTSMTGLSVQFYISAYLTLVVTTVWGQLYEGQPDELLILLYGIPYG